jgi:hypothetical protein
MEKIQKVIPATILFLFLLSGFSFGFQYPEFVLGKKTIEETSVATSYGTLKSSFISSGDRYYVLWELRGGSKNCTLLLSLSDSEEWSVRIGEDVAALPVSEEEVACMMVGETVAKAQTFPWFKILRLSADEALYNAPEHWFHYDMLYLMLSGEVHPVVKENLSLHTEVAAQIGDKCEDLYGDGVMMAYDNYQDFLSLCKRDLLPEDQPECRWESRKALLEMRRICLEVWIKCIEKKGPTRKK